MSDDQVAKLQNIIAGAVALANSAYALQQELQREGPNTGTAQIHRSTELPTDLIDTGIAAKLARCQAGTVRSWCVNRPAEAGAIKLKGRWFVSRKRFIEFLQTRS